VESSELVTVMIPARNEEDFLGACLDSVREQDYHNLQIVVVDGASTDKTADVVRARMAVDDRIELLTNPHQSIPRSLNLAVDAARGRWLVRVDAHSTVPADYVSIAVERLREGVWGGVGGRKDGIGKTSAGRAIAVAMGSRFGVGNSTYHYGTEPQEVDHLPFGAYPVELIRRHGGWDESLVANEDFEFDYRLRQAGEKLLFDPRMVIRWHCRQSLRDLYRQYRRYGQGKVDVVRRHPTSLSARHMAPPALVAYSALGAAVAMRNPGRSALMLAPYAIAIAAATAQTASRLESHGDRMKLPGAFVAMHVGWGVGFWSGLRKVTWEQLKDR
jgi:glycosyltransferase involved in cell wall biosynthesis